MLSPDVIVIRDNLSRLTIPPVTSSMESTTDEKKEIMDDITFSNITFDPYDTTITNGVISFGYYSNDEIAIQVYDLNDGPYTTATINLESYDLHPLPGHVFIQDYAENSGVWKGLVEAGIIGEPVETVTFGHYNASAVMCPLLVEV